MKTDRSRLIGSKEPSGNFCKAFSYVRFLFFRGSNYSIKTNRPSADRSGPIPDAGCVELMSSRTNGITSLLVTCDLFPKALSLFVMIRGVSISVIRGIREWQSYTTDFTSVRCPWSRRAIDLAMLYACAVMEMSKKYCRISSGRASGARKEFPSEISSQLSSLKRTAMTSNVTYLDYLVVEV